jgi:hypothetical protein
VDKVDLKVQTTAVSEVDSETLENADRLKSGKKSFITPEISAPVDVLEATTFFQAVSSGQTN